MANAGPIASQCCRTRDGHRGKPSEPACPMCVRTGHRRCESRFGGPDGLCDQVAGKLGQCHDEACWCKATTVAPPQVLMRYLWVAATVEDALVGLRAYAPRLLVASTTARARFGGLVAKGVGMWYSSGSIAQGCSDCCESSGAGCALCVGGRISLGIGVAIVLSSRPAHHRGLAVQRCGLSISEARISSARLICRGGCDLQSVHRDCPGIMFSWLR